MLRHCLSAITIIICTLWCAAAQSTTTQDAGNNGAATEEKFDSPRLATLAKEVKAENRAAIEAFWLEMKDKAPLLEPIASEEKFFWVTFVWRGDSNIKRVGMFGGLPAGGEGPASLARLMDTELWYRTIRMRNDARFTYNFV